MSTEQAQPQTTVAAPPGRLAHLVLKPEWPRALCGYIVMEHLGVGAPGRDRCADCLRIAGKRELGRPGWTHGA